MRNSGILPDFESVGSRILQKLQLFFLEILKFLCNQFGVVHGGGGWIFSGIAHYVIVESFHSETERDTFLLIPRDELLFSVLKDITDNILKQAPIESWSHYEINVLKLIGERPLGNIPNFAALKSLTVYINKVARSLPYVEFL